MLRITDEDRSFLEKLKVGPQTLLDDGIMTLRLADIEKRRKTQKDGT